MHGLSLVAVSGGYSVAVRRLLIVVGSLVAAHRLSGRRLQQLQHAGSAVVGAWTQLLCGMWILPQPGFEPTPCIGRWILIYCTTRRVLYMNFSSIKVQKTHQTN